MADYIFTMQGVTKVHPPDKKVVENLYLSFLPGAKIGIIGVNGTGKSTVLRIMAGVDTNFTGEAWKRAGLTVGYLEQEPEGLAVGQMPPLLFPGQCMLRMATNESWKISIQVCRPG